MSSPVEISLERGSGLLERERHHKHAKTKTGKMASAFLSRNQQGTTRVFVAGGSRAGHRQVFEQEAFHLGQEIGRHDYRLDFGLSSRGIMGAVARGVLDSWAGKAHHSEKPIHAVTTREYLALYQSDEVIDEVADIIVARTLEDRKQQLLDADFVIFAPGGLGTLDELAYDCIAMQDGFLNLKPFVLYNVDGFFHHLLEYLKEIHLKGFADAMPFIVVDNSMEAGIAFEMIGRYYNRSQTKEQVRKTVEQIIHELPYVIEQKQSDESLLVTDILAEKDKILKSRNKSEKQNLISRMENAYLNKEIDRMYNRLAKTGRDTATASFKLTSLKKRSVRRKG